MVRFEPAPGHGGRTRSVGGAAFGSLDFLEQRTLGNQLLSSLPRSAAAE
jgi:hypothetical protein